MTSGITSDSSLALKNKPKLGYLVTLGKASAFLGFIYEFGPEAREKHGGLVLNTQVMKCLFMLMKLSPLLLISPVDFMCLS